MTTCKFDAVLLDCEMSGMNGWDVAFDTKTCETGTGSDIAFR